MLGWALAGVKFITTSKLRFTKNIGRCSHQCKQIQYLEIQLKVKISELVRKQ